MALSGGTIAKSVVQVIENAVLKGLVLEIPLCVFHTHRVYIASTGKIRLFEIGGINL